MTNLEKNWFVLFTRPGFEKRVSNLLGRKNIVNYCPIKRQRNAKKKGTIEVLFSSFVFVKIEETEMASIRLIDNVVNFVYWLGKPAKISQEEIEIMSRFINEYANLRLEKIPLVQQSIIMERATNIKTKTHLVTVKNNIVKITLPSLGYMIVAEIENSSLEVINSVKQQVTIIGKYQFAI